MGLFLCLSGILLELYYQKVLSKAGGLEKCKKVWDAHKGRVSLEWEFIPSADFDTRLE